MYFAGKQSNLYQPESPYADLHTFFMTPLHSCERAQLVSRERELASTSASGLLILAAVQLRWLVREWEAWLRMRYRRQSVPLRLAARAARPGRGGNTLVHTCCTIIMFNER